MTLDGLENWIGRIEVRQDTVAPAPFARLAATLDHAEPPWRDGEMPPLGHWLCFLPTAPQSEIGPDGQPSKRGFLPPIELPRREWARSRLAFYAPVAIGDRLQRQSTIVDVRRQHGQSGAFVSVMLRHELANDIGPETAKHRPQEISE